MTPFPSVLSDRAAPPGASVPHRGCLGALASLAERLLQPSARARLEPAVDLAAIGAAAIAAFFAGGRGQLTVGNASLGALYAAFVLGLMLARHARTKRLMTSLIDAWAQALALCSMAVICAIAADSILRGDHLVPMALRLWLLTIAFLCGVRAVLLLIERRARRRGALMSPTLIVGPGVIGSRIVHRLQDHPEYGFRPVGFLDSDPMPGTADPGPGVAVLGGPDDLVEISRSTGARHVILAISSESNQHVNELVERCQELKLAVLVVPRLSETVNGRASLDHLGGLPLVGLRRVDTKGWQFAVKHSVDRLAVSLALLILAPALVAIAIAVRLSSPGPVIFRQQRLGRDGHVFELLKFRTMLGDDGAAAFVHADGVAPGGIEGVDRRTRVGRWLRSTSLDELPQLVNVLRGEMSIIGPRPERPEFAAQFARDVPHYEDRHRVKSGITGWAQANGLRGQSSIADRVEWDNHYIQNWSLGLELRTIALTLAEILRFRDDKQPAPIEAPKTARQLVLTTAVSISPRRWFCGHCGAARGDDVVTLPVAGGCEQCGQRLMLQARSGVAPTADDAFLVIDSRLTVQALSAHAERILAIRELDATDRPLTELLVGADADGGTEESLAAVLARVTSNGEDAYYMFVRPRGTFGVRLRATISRCGPPHALLIVLDSAPTEPHSRLVGPATALVGRTDRTANAAKTRHRTVS